jgi:phosphonate transport system ATP-binding protein
MKIAAGKNNGSKPHVALEDVGLQRNGRWLFRNVTWEIPRGKVVAVVGSSGVGKSSLLNWMAGTLEATEGSITYCCQRGCSHGVGDYQKRIGIIFQNLSLIQNNTLLGNVLCGRLGRYSWWQTLSGFPRTDREEAYRLLVDLGLGEYVHRRVADVSGGEQQRTAVLRALFQEPELLLADEPVSNLDAYHAGRVLGILRQHAHEHQRTVLCVLHDASLVQRFADYVLSLNPVDPQSWRIRPVHG